MTDSFDFNHIKKRLAKAAKSGHRKLTYLSDSVSRNGRDGLIHWFKSHGQLEQIDEAIENLLETSQNDDFSLLLVATTLKSFKLPEEDQGQSEWYETAHKYLEDFEKGLTDRKVCELKKLQLACKELQFISNAHDFHERYKLQTIQQKVITMYKNLEQHISDFKVLEKEKIALKNNQDKTKIAELEKEKAEAEAKKVMLESVKIKEKRLAIIEEKKRIELERTTAEAQHAQQLELVEANAKQAEIERQAKLQDAYVELQLEEKISNWNAKELAKFMLKKLPEANMEEKKHQELLTLLEEISDD